MELRDKNNRAIRQDEITFPYPYDEIDHEFDVEDFIKKQDEEYKKKKELEKENESEIGQITTWPRFKIRNDRKDCVFSLCDELYNNTESILIYYDTESCYSELDAFSIIKQECDRLNTKFEKKIGYVNE